MVDSIASDMEIIEKLTDSERQSLINRILTEQEELIKDIEIKLKEYKILSTLPYQRVDFWIKNVSTITRNRGLRELIKFFSQLFFYNRNYDIVLLAGGERTDLFYLAIAGLLNICKTPHIVVDAHWQKSKNIAHLLQKIMLILGSRIAVQFQPHSEEEIELYNRNFGIPIEKLKSIPWSTSLIGYNIIPKKGNFILTGGASFRDYKTFLLAIRELNLPVEIGLPKNYSLPLRNLTKGSHNILIHNSLTTREYYQKMANCRVFALPIEPKLERCTGDQTLLNAMYFGKIVIATDSIGSRIYIKDGINGFLVPEADVAAWNDKIKYVFNMDEKEYSKISSKAEYDAKVVFNENIRLFRILKSVIDFLNSRSAR